jgi:ribosome biogenesis GTPase
MGGGPVKLREGKIAFGANNIFTVLSEGDSFICRIKGKVLREEEVTYNPLAPGDEVEFAVDEHTRGEGRILRRKERRNSLVRWNKKRQARQTIAANIDVLVCVTSVGNPPFRPRFIDRILIGAVDMDVVIAINKTDLGIPPVVAERAENYRQIGYSVIFCSAMEGTGIAELESRISGKTCVYFGQSGVGKSSLINRLYPGLRLEIGSISHKYDRGRHTTKNSILVEHKRGTLIDTPGIRQIDLVPEEPGDLDSFFPDFSLFIGKCEFQPCSHIHEPGCAVREAVQQGRIHPDRYESYVRMYRELEEKKNTYA